MKTILIAGLAAVLPALAQTRDDTAAREQRRAELDAVQHDLQNLTATVVLNAVFRGTVKNAPYSADAVTETTQMLTDGNRIEQRTTQKLYRDSDGRERREESVFAVGALAQTGAPRTITISDPVENVSYSLDPQAHTARRNPGLGAVGSYSVVNSTNLGISIAKANPAGTGEQLTATRVPAGAHIAKEDLGSKNIEGVVAKGTRTTETIPAGQIGNQLPIKVVDEVWYSSELQMNVLTTHSDPRSGETAYKLTNIIRSNPSPTLFEPPSDYTLTGPAAGAGRGRGGRGPAPDAQK